MDPDDGNSGENGTDDSESFRSFECEMLRQGYDVVLKRPWQADAVVATHSHPFDAKARVVQGEMWLTVGENTRHIGTGGGFELAAGTPHSERYGTEGATYWVGRRDVPQRAD